MSKVRTKSGWLGEEVGTWVSYDDYKQLEAHADALSGELELAKGVIEELEAVIADVRKLPDEWEEQDAQAQWPADVPNGSQCADDLRAAIKRGE